MPSPSLKGEILPIFHASSTPFPDRNKKYVNSCRSGRKLVEARVYVTATKECICTCKGLGVKHASNGKHCKSAVLQFTKLVEKYLTLVSDVIRIQIQYESLQLELFHWVVTL